MVGFYLNYSLSLSEDLVTSGSTGTGSGQFDINSQVSFLLKFKGICIKESKFVRVMPVSKRNLIS